MYLEIRIKVNSSGEISTDNEKQLIKTFFLLHLLKCVRQLFCRYFFVVLKL